MRASPDRAAVLLAATAALTLALSVGACTDTPTEFSPLVRAVGDVRTVALRFENMATLTPTDGIYEAFALLERNDVASLGRFNVDAAGRPVDADGNPIEIFESDVNLLNALGILVTIEPPNDTDANPSGFSLLQGPFADGVARLTVPGPSDLGNAGGAYRIFSPTDGPGTNETSGAWAVAADGSALLGLPEATRGFTYEAFVITATGRALTMARFDDPEGPDLNNPFSGPEPAPQFPGEDFVANAPEGIQFPLDLSGLRILVTLEARAPGAGVADPSQLVVLEGIVPGSLSGGDLVTLVNRAASFPTGSAVIF